MKKIKFNLLIILFIFHLIIFSQTIIPGGDVSGTWTKENSPYLIEGEITIPDRFQLTIEPGVLIEFQGHYKFNVQGKIQAIGELSDTITFTINDTTNFSNMEIPDGGWHGLRFHNEFTTDTSMLTFCKLEFGKAIGNQDDNNRGGAIWASDYSVLLISNCLIINNRSKTDGGGMYDRFTDVVIENSSFLNNKAEWIGGGLYTGESYIVNCKFEYNYAYSEGGGINWDGYSPTLINNLIANNSSGHYGGGIGCVDDFGARLINNTICNNNAVMYGGGIKITCVFGKLEFINTIFYGNIAESGNQVSGAGGTDLIEFWYCNIEGGFEGFGGLPFQGTYIGNIDIDPLFSNTGEHAYSLTPTSPCIDTGMPDTTGLSLPLFDLAGNPRIYNNRIDIGAYEYFTTGLSHPKSDNISLEVFPNPSSGSFYLSTGSDLILPYKVELLNCTGKSLRTYEINDREFLINANDLPKGIYLLEISSNNDKFYKKIIIQ